MLEVQLEEIIVIFDEEVQLTEEEIINISVGLSHLEMNNGTLSLTDKPRIRQMINDELDRLNKAGNLSDEAVQNNTYTLKEVERVYTVETQLTLTKVDSVSATSKEEAIEIVEGLEDTDTFIDNISEYGDYHGVTFRAIGRS